MKFLLLFLLSIFIISSPVFAKIPIVPPFPQNDCDPNDIGNVLNDRKPSSRIGCSNGKPGGKSPQFSGENGEPDQRPNIAPAPKASGYKPNDERLINAIQLFQNMSPIFINGFGNNPPPPCSANCFALKEVEEQKACIKRCAACWDEKQCDQCGDDKQCREKCYEEQIYCDYVLPKDGHGGTYLQCRWHMKTQSPPLCVEFKYTPSGECPAQTDFKDNIYGLNGVDLPGVYKCGNCTADVAGNVFCNFTIPTKLPGYNLNCVYRKLYAENGQNDYEYLCATVPFIEVDQLKQ